MHITRPLPSLLVATLTLCSFALACDGGNLTLDVDQSRVQKHVEQAFPQEHDLRGVATLTMMNPKVNLAIGGDRIGLLTDLQLARPGIPLTLKGQATTSGTMRYERTNGTFYMTDVRIEALDVPMPLISAAQKQKLLDLTNATLQGSLKDIAIYSLENTPSHEAARALLKSATIKDNKLHIVMGYGK